MGNIFHTEKEIMSIKFFLYIILAVFGFYLITLVLGKSEFWKGLTFFFLVGAALAIRHIAEKEK